MQCPSHNALRQGSGQNAVPTVEFYSARQAQKQAVCHCSYTYGDMLLIQVCNDPATKHCSTVQGKMQSPIFSVALQNRLTAKQAHSRQCVTAVKPTEICSSYKCALTHHKCTPMHFRTGQGKKHFPLFSAALQNRLTAGLCHCSHTYGAALHTGVR